MRYDVAYMTEVASDLEQMLAELENIQVADPVVAQEAQQNKEAERAEEFITELTPFMTTIKPVFAVLKDISLPYAVLRHVGILMALFDRQALTLLDEFPEEKYVNDIDILMAFDESKIIAFRDELNKMPNVKNVVLELPDTPNREVNPDAFESKAFLKFEIVEDISKPDSRVFKVEMFADFGVNRDDGERELVFAALDVNKNEAGNAVPNNGNILHKVSFPLESGALLEVPLILGEGVAQSYAWQNAEARRAFLETFDPEVLKSRPGTRQVLVEIVEFLLDLPVLNSQKHSAVY